MDRIPKPIFERRRWVRIDETLPFKIGHRGYDIQAKTLNISMHGVMCLVDKDIPIMTQLEIALALPASGRSKKEQKVKAKGVVVRKEKDAASGKFFIAIYFLDISPKTRGILNKFIESRIRQKGDR